MQYDPEVLFKDVIQALEACEPLEERQFRLIYDYTCRLMLGKLEMDTFALSTCHRFVRVYVLHEEEIRKLPNSFDWAAVWSAFSVLEQYRRIIKQDVKDRERIEVVRRYLDLFEAISINPWCNQRRLMRLFGSSASNISQKIKAIRRAGDLVIEVRMGSVKLYNLTETGARILRDLRPELARANKERERRVKGMKNLRDDTRIRKAETLVELFDGGRKYPISRKSNQEWVNEVVGDTWGGSSAPAKELDLNELMKASA